LVWMGEDEMGLGVPGDTSMSVALIHQPKIDLFPISNFTFTKKKIDLKSLGGPFSEREMTQAQRLSQLKEFYEQNGKRRSVEACLLFHQHNHPHVFALQQDEAYFTLPGGWCEPREDEITCLRRYLTALLGPAENLPQPKWEIIEPLCQWTRPDFEAAMYPYQPPHVTRPKEVKTVFLVSLPEKTDGKQTIIGIPDEMHVVALPLFELYENTRRYGTIMASLPLCLSRFFMNCLQGS